MKIRIENLCKNFKQEHVLKNITIEFEPGNIYGLVGKNGSGKTVLFKCMIGLLKPTSGKIFYDNEQLGENMDFAPNTGFIIETPGFLPQYTGYKNLKYLANIQNIIDDEDIIKAIELVGLDAKSKKRVGKYSLGMRQRLGIAQAIMENPQVLILDEPMNGLDQEGIEEVKQLLISLKNQGKTIILASHYLEDMEICDIVYGMEHGNITKR